MIKVGLTGNLASGKTTVADRWREAGVPVIDADRVGHAVLAEDPEVRAALVAAFGDEIERSDGEIDRAELGNRAFASTEGIARLNEIVHPPLVARLRDALKEAARESHEVVAVDAALILEFGFDRELDLVVLVTAPRRYRVERSRLQRAMDDDQIDRVMAAQQPDVEKARSSDYVIVNDSSVERLRAKADLVLAAIRRRVAAGG